MTRLLLLALLATAAHAQDTLRVALEPVPGTGPFDVALVPAQALAGPGLAPPSGLPDTLAARAFDEPVWVPGTEGWEILAWAVAETADGGFVTWVDTDGDRDLGDETARRYAPLAVPEGEDPRRAAAAASQGVAADTVAVRHAGRDVRVTLWPSLYNVGADGEPLRDPDGATAIYVRVGLHQRGTLALGGTTHPVLVGRSSGTEAPYTDETTRVRVGDGEPVGVGDVVRLADRAVRVVSMEADGSALLLLSE